LGAKLGSTRGNRTLYSLLHNFFSMGEVNPLP
jgi:hypothetical protein